ncbi:MAG: hypothetical protein JWR51_4694 [Devosia sp.]|uniref:hypothetical protein n=1 Tax=Devosia sp. TaxID=1871048 RepID=UPI00262738A2|nr:hypothetical protein [Devosia sp.]MDB5531591.1 hypothetical protein [Devosia sp.]
MSQTILGVLALVVGIAFTGWYLIDLAVVSYAHNTTGGVVDPPGFWLLAIGLVGLAGGLPLTFHWINI